MLHVPGSSSLPSWLQAPGKNALLVHHEGWFPASTALTAHGRAELQKIVWVPLPEGVIQACTAAEGAPCHVHVIALLHSYYLDVAQR